MRKAAKKSPAKAAKKSPARVASNRATQIWTAVELACGMSAAGIAQIRSGDPDEITPGVMNAVVWAHDTTYMLQNFRGVSPDFDPWWEAIAAKMSADPLMRFFHRLRTQILKAATNQVVLRLKAPDLTALGRVVGMRPTPGAQLILNSPRGFAWRWREGDELITRDIPWPEALCGPKHIIFESTKEAKVPDEFELTPVGDLCEMYLQNIEAIADEAIQRFHVPTPGSVSL